MLTRADEEESVGAAEEAREDVQEEREEGGRGAEGCVQCAEVRSEKQKRQKQNVKEKIQLIERVRGGNVHRERGMRRGRRQTDDKTDSESGEPRQSSNH